MENFVEELTQGLQNWRAEGERTLWKNLHEGFRNWHQVGEASEELLEAEESRYCRQGWGKPWMKLFMLSLDARPRPQYSMLGLNARPQVGSLK